MKAKALLVFLLLFLGVTLGVPFILATVLPTIYALLGSFGISLVTGVLLFWILSKIGKEASPTS